MCHADNRSEMADVSITTQIGSPCVNWLGIHHVRPAAAAADIYIEEAIASTQRNTSKASVRRVRREGLIDNGSQIKSEKKNDREGKKPKTLHFHLFEQTGNLYGINEDDVVIISY